MVPRRVDGAMIKKKPFYTKKRFIIPIVIVGLVLLAFRVSPVPAASIVRVVFDSDARDKRTAMQAIVGEINDVSVVSNISYRENDKHALLDIYTPQQEALGDSLLPVVIWTHGGAWLSGDKTDVTPYFKKLAQQGFVVVALNYSLAPAKQYPHQAEQVNAAYGFVQKNIVDYKGDSSKLVLAGDSAGAQLSSQVAALTTNPSYAKEVGITPAIDPSNIAALVLYCGIYKMEDLAEPHANLSRIISWGNRTTVWSFTGSRTPSSDLIRQMSAYYHVDANFPDAFISGGNADPLTKAQSAPLSSKLQSLGVDVETLFYEDDHEPAHSHENQFILDEDGLKNFQTMADFIKRKTGVTSLASE